MESITKDKSATDKTTSFIWLVIMIFCIFFIYGLSWFFIDKYIELNERGPFGDKFGAINALFSGLAFAGVIYTILLQKKELSLQREELQLTRQEMKEQTDEFEKQNKTLKLQRFENTFFQMMDLQQQIVNNLEVTERIVTVNPRFSKFHGQNYQEEDVVHRGRVVFDRLFKSQIDKRGDMLYILSSIGLHGYSSSEIISLFDHYFHHLYTILVFIDQTKAFTEDKIDVATEKDDFNQKYFYAKILRATLSRYELVLLYYNGLSVNGREKLKPLLEKYSMLNNLNIDLLALSKENIDFFKKNGNKDFYSFQRKYNYELSDFYFYLTEESNDIHNYSLSTFYHGNEELDKGQKILHKFRMQRDEFIKESTI